MNHRQTFDSVLRDMPKPKAAYLARLAYELECRAEMEDRGHLMYPVLAAAAPGIEPMLEPGEAADIATAFLLREAEGIAAALYSPAYLTAPGEVLSPWAERLRADLAAVILDRLAAGKLVPPDQRTWRFRSDRGDVAFPYGDEEDEEL